ncbi:histidine phosphatase family protein [Kitasatospora sp. McL0602]|uniref:histidine phosphatase family protein n=1 Tax=Kitasatospora sp. McL0602 TaxID=3439530 RepID=UPI003F8CC556
MPLKPLISARVRTPALTRRGLLAGLLLASTGCGPSAKAAPAAPVVPTADTTVIIIRHGEKPDAAHPGHDETGHPDPKSLTDRGWARAQALPGLFGTALPRPASIFAAADQGPHAGAHRMRQTVTPLSQHLGLPLDTTHPEGQEAELARAALAAPAPVLICWEHSRIPAIVQALGATTAPGTPKTWPDRFDLAWVLTSTAGVWSFHETHQHLLPGDA